jgi:rhamnosyltransferase
MISVIIPTLNAEIYIDDLLSSLKGQSVKCEIFIVDSSSLDKTASIAASENAKVVTVRREDFNHGKARNIGVQEAAGDIVVFFTQDALPYDEHCLENLLKPLESCEIVASYGRQMPRSDASPRERFARLFNYDDKPMIKGREDISSIGIKTFFFSNVCSAIKVKEFKELGGFPENIIMFEDLIFSAKAILKGYKIAYVPEAKVLHSHNFSLMQQFQRYLDAGLSLRNNAWIFEHVKANKEGLTFLKQEILYLSKKHHYRWILCALAESVLKFAGFWLGMHGVKSCRTTGGVPRTLNNA